MPRWLSLGFQDRSSPAMGELFCLHDHVIVIMMRIIILISYIITYLIYRGFYYKFLSEGTFIETVWSLVPAFLLIILVLPSIKVLYIVEDVNTPSFTFKIIAHQWYWTYAVPFYNNIYLSSDPSTFLKTFDYDSLLDRRNSFHPRLFSCSSDLFVPVNTTSRLLITSTDVIHSFAVPAIGLKVDALPGRINQLFSSPSRVGLFFGQCSEICGSNHSFMPIRLKVCSLQDFDEISRTYLINTIFEYDQLV